MPSRLPLAFLDKMRWILEEEYDLFLSSYNAERVYGLRLNALKLDMEKWQQLSPFAGMVRTIPWASATGMYYGDNDRPGKHPYYHAGLYYIQEPSAMAPAELLDVKPGQRVLDLCAAPGGKSTQIAGKLQGSGVLVCNDNARERTKALAKNIELAGVRNAVILNEEPSRLAEVFPQWFERILIDAPCSGEGMFRKDDSMIAEWGKHSVEKCSLMQRDILREAAAILAPGGKIVYSTCTFSPEENEGQLALFLAEHPDFEVERIEPLYGWQPGRPDLAAKPEQLSQEALESLRGTVRLWPHHIEGEGHYAAVLKRHGKTQEVDHSYKPNESLVQDGLRPISIGERRGGKGESLGSGGRLRRQDRGPAGKGGKPGRRDKGAASLGREEDPVQLWNGHIGDVAPLAHEWAGRIVSYGSFIYIQPLGVPSLNGLQVVRPGWYVGEMNHGRLEPTQPLALAMKQEEAARSVSWPAEDERTIRYLKGETVFVEEAEIVVQGDASARGYVLVCTDGYPIGWAKYADGKLNNRLPAGWRWM